ncbi:MAG: phosphate ABC transporter permease subunit PstC [Candidatus Limnocylindrus sp.]
MASLELRRTSGLSADSLFRRVTGAGLLVLALALASLVVALFSYSNPIWTIQSPIDFLTSATWSTGTIDESGQVVDALYGALGALFGTAATSLIAVLFAAPIGILAAIYLVEFAPPRLAAPLTFIVELIAAIPSVVFGLWAAGDLSDRLRDTIEWWIASSFGRFLPFLSEDPESPAADSVFRAGFLLAIMILPMVVAVSREFIRSVPISLREGYIGMGATKWEVIRDVILPTARIGLIGGVLLALGRAIGETVAVTMVIGNAEGIPSSLFQPGQTVASKIASNISEASGEIAIGAMAALGLSLFLLTTVISLGVRVLVRRFSVNGGRA